MQSVSLLSVVTASIVAFVIGAVWYSPFLFGRKWMVLANINNIDMAANRRAGVGKLYSVHFIFILVSLAVLGFIISTSNAATSTDGAIWGFVVWLGFSVPTGLTRCLWEKCPISLFFIDSINILISLVIGGAIIAGLN